MRLLKKNWFLSVALLQLVAIVVGISAALFFSNISFVAAAPLGQVAKASAANHCNNFFPHDYGADNNCNTFGSIEQIDGGITSSIRHRDGLEMRTTGNSTTVQLFFYGLPEVYFSNTNLAAIDGNGTYRYAGCNRYSDYGGTTGRCRSNWHDA
jgi:hypothetical protein